MTDSQMDDMIKETLALKKQIDFLEQNLSNQIKEKESLLQTFTIFKNESKEKESKYMDKEIDLDKEIKELDNIVYKAAQRIKPTLYDGSLISSQHDVILVIDDEETLILEEIVLWYLDFRCSKHMTGNRSQLMNFVSLFLGTIRFGNDHIAKIMDLEVAFWKNTCFIWNLDGVDLLSSSRDTNLYTISLDDMLKTSSVYLISKASNTKSWLWHCRLSHLNFGTLNKLAKDGLVRGIPKLKFKKDRLCSAGALGKSNKSSHQPKAEDTNQEKLYLLHMDLFGPMRVKFLRSRDEAPEAIIKCIKNIQVRLNVTVRNVRIDNKTKFVNQTLREFYENVRISHQTSVAQNCSLLLLRYNKTPYELIHDKNPDLSFLHVSGSLYYPTNNSEDLGKQNAKADIGIFVGYTPAKKAFRNYNRRTWKIMETILVMFDELTSMASEQFSSEPGPQLMTPATSNLGLVPNPVPQQPFNPPTRNDWDQPKNFKEAMLESSWIEAMHEEIHEFERLQVWESVPCPDKVMLIKLKWIFKVKIDKFGGVLKNKARLVAQGFSKYRQQEYDNLPDGRQNGFLKWRAQRRGLQTSQSPRGIFINQSKYASEIIKKYGMLTNDSVDTPMAKKNKLDVDLQGTPVDATHYHDMIGSLMYLTSRSAQFLGDKLVSWSSKKQKSTTILSIEVEYIALSGCCAQILWMRSHLTDFGFQFNKIPLYCDNKSAIALCCNNVQYSRAKHIDVRYHFIKEQVKNRIVELYFFRTEYQLADIFTKPLPRERFKFLIEKLGMKSMSPETLKSLAEEEDE
ncbi:retrovirus-related pol polyprotein from transposon TNT 1-94 [Tanacetum coccineum]